MLSWLRRWWHARQRAIDMQILWPQCVRLAGDVEQAKMCFAVHAFNDPAWLELGRNELFRIIDELV